MGLMDNFKLPAGLPVPDIGGALGKIVGDKAKEVIAPAVGAAKDMAADGAMSAQRMVAIGRLPDALDLAKSPKLEMYVEKGLVALGAKGIKVDGKPDQATLDGLNTVLEQQKRGALDSLSAFSKDDLKAFNTALGDSRLPNGEPNKPAGNVLNTGAAVFTDALKDYPKPAPAPTPRGQEFSQ